MTEHFGGSGSPAEGLSVVPEGLVIGLGYAMRQDGCELLPDIRSNAASQEFDRPQHLLVGKGRHAHLRGDSRKTSENFVHVEYLLRHLFSISDNPHTGGLWEALLRHELQQRCGCTPDQHMGQIRVTIL